MERIWLTPTDTDESLGTAPEVSGTALSLLLAISGRQAVLTELEGSGLQVLTSH